MSQTVSGLRRAMARRLAATSSSAALDARLLAAHVLALPPSELALHDDDNVGAAAVARLEALVARRALGEPVARIVGEKEFYGLDFALGPETLVPRPDTETVVEAALAFVDQRGLRDADLRILDLGTGSGAILVALLAHLPRALGVGVDLSEEALAVAAANARRHGVAQRVRFVAGNWTDAVRETFDVAVSNPPYIPADEIDLLAPEVRVFDPRVALDGGADGLDAIREILARLDDALAPGGMAFVEIGAGQSEMVAALASEKGFAVGFRADLAGIKRVAELARG